MFWRNKDIEKELTLWLWNVEVGGFLFMALPAGLIFLTSFGLLIVSVSSGIASLTILVYLGRSFFDIAFLDIAILTFCLSVFLVYSHAFITRGSIEHWYEKNLLIWDRLPIYRARLEKDIELDVIGYSFRNEHRMAFIERLERLKEEGMPDRYHKAIGEIYEYIQFDRSAWFLLGKD